MSKGAFLSLEGIDGSGKSTAMEYLVTLLTELGYEVVQTREPGGTELAEKIREMVLSNVMNPITELLMFGAARADHIHNVIKPKLALGNVVVSDRFADSTLAYQGFGRGLLEETMQLAQIVQKGFHPDYTLYFNVNLSESQRRVEARQEIKNHFDTEKQAFRKNMDDGYKVAQLMAGPRAVPINANQSISGVQLQIYDWVIEVFVPKHPRPVEYFSNEKNQRSVINIENPNASRWQKDEARLYLEEYCDRQPRMTPRARTVKEIPHIPV